MPSIAVQEAFVAISAATNKGVMTVASADYLFPGARAWVSMDDGSLTARVKILAVLSSTQIQVRRYRNNDENAPPSYGTSDMSAFNGSAHIAMEAQDVPVDPSYAKRVVS
jgi:hypothetical protein